MGGGKVKKFTQPWSGGINMNNPMINPTKGGINNDIVRYPLAIGTYGLSEGARAMSDAMTPEVPKDTDGEPAIGSPSAMMDETPGDTAAAKRRKLERMRMGLAKTIMTSPTGDTSSPLVAAPVAGAGGKTKLGQ